MKSHSERAAGKVIAENRIVDNGFWDIEDLSNYLKVKVKTIYAMISDIPHYRVGKLIRFRKQEIDSWMENNKGKAHHGKDKSTNIREKQSNRGNISIDQLIRNTIDQTKDEVYTPEHGKSDQIKGLGKEVS